jgi:hypothetical protein
MAMTSLLSAGLGGGMAQSRALEFQLPLGRAEWETKGGITKKKKKLRK